MLEDLLLVFAEMLCVIFTSLCNAALLTFWRAGQADIAAMQDEPVMGFMDQSLGEMFDELQFRL